MTADPSAPTSLPARGAGLSTASRVLANAGPTITIAETARVLGCSRDLIYAMHQHPRRAAGSRGRRGDPGNARHASVRG